MYLKSLKLLSSKDELRYLSKGKLLINTINAHSYNVALNDVDFDSALRKSDVLLPDGISIVKACKWLNKTPRPYERVTGWDLFSFEMDKLNLQGGKCFFMGSSEAVLSRIREKVTLIYPNIIVETYSPPYKQNFNEKENKAIITAINNFNPDLLWVGMTAPKQEKWLYHNWDELKINCHAGAIGAVFDFFAGTTKRAPLWWQNNDLEWLYRLMQEPKRMWKRYIVGNILFLWNILREKFDN